jgi:hypothetical protein
MNKDGGGRRFRLSILPDEPGWFRSTGVLPCVPKTLTSGNAKRGLFTGQDFIYDDEKDHYTCPAGQHPTRGRVRSDRVTSVKLVKIRG